MSQFLITILAEIARMERKTIRERMNSGYKNYRENGGVYESIEEIWPDYPTKEDFLFNEDEY